MTGNSLAYLLRQEEKKRAMADVVSNKKPDMRKISLVVATLILTGVVGAGVGVWVASSAYSAAAQPLAVQ
jgi:hypothetical protein